MAEQGPDGATGPWPASNRPTDRDRPFSRRIRRPSVWWFASTLLAVAIVAIWVKDGGTYVFAYVGAVAALFALGATRHAPAGRAAWPLEENERDRSVVSPDLLNALVRTSNSSRHRAASALHAQALTAHVIVMALEQLTDERPASPAAKGLTTQIGRALADQADNHRSLVAATAVVDCDNDLNEMLVTYATAHVTSIYGPARPPDLSFDIAEGLMLDWPTESAVLGIVKHALDEVHRQNRARSVDVVLTADTRSVDLRVSYMAGVGRSAGTAPGPSRSTMAAMHAFASSLDGTIDATRSEDGHTTITATLCTHIPNLASPEPHSRAGHRHLSAVPDAR